MSKSLFGLTYFQEIFAEYIDVADSSDIRALASSVADPSIHLLSTRAGARVVAACASYGTPKDRKSTRSELQSHSDLVCRLLLEKKKINETKKKKKKTKQTLPIRLRPCRFN